MGNDVVIPEAVLKHITKTSQFMGKVNSHLIIQGEQLEDIQVELKHKASRRDVKKLEKKVCKHHEIILNPKVKCPAAERQIDNHITLFHPSQEEIVGRQVLGAMGWLKENKLKAVAVMVLSFISSYFGIELSGVI